MRRGRLARRSGEPSTRQALPPATAHPRPGLVRADRLSGLATLTGNRALRRFLSFPGAVIRRVTNPDTGTDYTSGDLSTLWEAGKLTVEYSHPYASINVDKDFAREVYNYAFSVKRGATTVAALHLHFDGDPEDGGKVRLTKLKSDHYGKTLAYNAPSKMESDAKGMIPSGAKAT